MSEIVERLADIRCQVTAAAERVGRSPDAVRLLAVSKTKPAKLLQEAVDAGQCLFGENYVQTAAEKFPQLQPGEDQPLEFHLIGSLQRNKVKRAVEIFDVIETVGRIEVAEEISKRAQQLEKAQRILLQVNISQEEAKSGCLPEGVVPLSEQILSLPNLQLEGLMSIGRWLAPGEEEEDERRAEFAHMRTLRDDVANQLGISLPELSMGMSGDFELAIEEGATIVRVGSSIFGPREN